MLEALPYKAIVIADFEFEFGGRDGDRPRPVCMVAKDLRSGQEWRIWRGEFPSRPPFPIGSDTLFVAFVASAELGCFRALGWPIPSRILDLYAEFRNHVNGSIGDRGLIAAMNYFGLDAMSVVHKQQMVDLILAGGPWTDQERTGIFDYCAGDTNALERLLPVMLPQIDLPRALLRGRYMPVDAAIGWNGIPIDMPTLAMVRPHWTDIQDQLIADIDTTYGVYDGRTFKEDRFEQFLIRNGIPWDRLDTGRLCLDRDTFREMARAYPIISPLRELRHALSDLRLNDLSVGDDGRNRTPLWPFGSKTGRNQPSNSKFIFGPSVWLRGLIKPPPGHAVAYIDWSSQEVGVAAALSGDEAMMADFQTGDPYIAFGIRAGVLPTGATKETHREERDMLKACVLGLQYGMREQTLAARIGKPTIVARELVWAHRDRYRKFWRMAEGAVDCAMLGLPISTVFGWHVRAGSGLIKPRKVGERPRGVGRSMLNFPMQANGAEMMRLAACLATERGIEVCAPVHDAFLICAPLDQIDARVAEMKFIMEEASRIVLNGFTIKADCPEVDENGKLLEFPQIVRYPDRYMDKRGAVMWQRVMRLLAQFESVEKVA
jgi:DNA polymerase-1